MNLICPTPETQGKQRWPSFPSSASAVPLWFFILLPFFGSAVTLGKAGEISPVTVAFPSGSEQISAKMFVPYGKRPLPAVILIHEGWGLTEWVERQAADVTGHDFVTLAVDLYRGRVTHDRNEADEWMRGLTEDRAVRDLSAAMEYLQNSSKVQKGKIGAMGWGMGGGLALKFAMARPDLACCVVFYGSLPTEKSSIQKITCPMIGFFGAEDRSIPLEAITNFKRTADELGGKNISVRIYERAGHAFMNDTEPSYHKPAAVDAWKRALTFLSNNLQ